MKIKSCPKCGDQINNVHIDIVKHTNLHFAICRDCKRVGPFRKTENQAVDAWNNKGEENADDD